MDRNKKDIRLVTDEKIAETSSKGNQEKWFDADSNHRQSSKMYIGKTKVFAMTSLHGCLTDSRTVTFLSFPVILL